eukprot:EG_transcript_51116
MVGGLRDKSAYVRRVAASAAAKLFRRDQAAVLEAGITDRLYELVCDTDGAVSSAALRAVFAMEGGGKMVSPDLAAYLLNRLPELPEWQQCVAADCIGRMVPPSPPDLPRILASL